MLCIFDLRCGLCVSVRACAPYICGVVCVSLYICGVLNCDTKIAIYQDLFTYVIDVL